MAASVLIQCFTSLSSCRNNLGIIVTARLILATTNCRSLNNQMSSKLQLWIFCVYFFQFFQSYFDRSVYFTRNLRISAQYVPLRFSIYCWVFLCKLPQVRNCEVSLIISTIYKSLLCSRNIL